MKLDVTCESVLALASTSPANETTKFNRKVFSYPDALIGRGQGLWLAKPLQITVGINPSL